MFYSVNFMLCYFLGGCAELAVFFYNSQIHMRISLQWFWGVFFLIFNKLMA